MDIKARIKYLLKEWSKSYNPSWVDGVIYARYSQGGKQTDQSIEGQIEVDKKFADENQINIVDIFFDQHLTGTNEKRPDFQRMIALSRNARWSFVIVYDIERFGRNKDEIATNRRLLRANKKIVLSATQINSYNVDGSRNISGIIMESVHEGMAEYYSVELSFKVKRGQRKNLEKKVFLGGAVPFGYKTENFMLDGQEKKRLIIDADRAAIIRKIYALYLDGSTIEEIREYLRTNEIYNQFGRQFSKNQVILILQSERYIGNFTYGGKTYEDYQPAIIDKESFMKAQKRFKRNKETSGGGKAIIPYLLTTKIACLDCDNNMLGESGTSGTGKMYNYYKCFGAKKKCGCDMPAVPKDIIEEFVVAKTIEYVFKKRNLEDLARDLYLENEKEKAYKIKINLINQELEEVNASIKNIVQAIEKGLFSGIIQNRLLELEAEKERLESAIAYEEAILGKELPQEMILFFLEKMAKGDVTDVDYKLRIIETFIAKVYVGKDKVIICYRFNDDDGNKLDIDRSVLDEYIKKYEEKAGAASAEFVYSPVLPAKCDKSELILLMLSVRFFSFFCLLISALIKHRNLQ